MDNNIKTPFFTIAESYAWLIVDMQVEQSISYVILYMRFDAKYTYTHKVRIGNNYSYKAPGGGEFVDDNFACAENVTRVGTVGIYNCMRIVYGRYLSVQTMDKSTTSYLPIMDMTIGFTEDRKSLALSSKRSTLKRLYDEHLVIASYRLKQQVGFTNKILSPK